jgi:hypothetical protein
LGGEILARCGRIAAADGETVNQADARTLSGMRTLRLQRGLVANGEIFFGGWMGFSRRIMCKSLRRNGNGRVFCV